MTSWYVDTSAFLKLVVAEDHSDALLAWIDDESPSLFSCDLLRMEALRAARRHSDDATVETRRRLDVLTLVRLPTWVFDRAAALAPLSLRTLDAVHLSAALSLGDELRGLVTYDERLAAAAQHHGVTVAAPV